MIDPAPTTAIDKELTRAKLVEVIEATATTPAFLVLAPDNSEYKLRLQPLGGTLPEGIAQKIGQRLIGTVRAEAKRIDVVQSGGKFIDPVLGRPRRVQGRIIASNPAGGTVTISAGGNVPIVCKVTAPGQKAGDFELLSFVACQVQRGASFEIAG
ncbi:MAG: hypothetical protein ACI89L_001368 [Phycisphaerales bacterium]|jgi:hypothetical protein